MFDKTEFPDPCVMGVVRAAAAGEDRGESIRASVHAVLGCGGFETSDPALLCRMLVAVAEANLPVARIVEGHVNARHLLSMLDRQAVTGDAVFGVWGADGALPLGLNAGLLSGGKRYASGLGTVTDAIVTVGAGDEIRLARVDVTDAARHHAEAWQMQGMRATVSGEVDLTGLSPEWIGAPGAYFREPSFLGGVWRIAALQLGGTFGLIGAARDALSEVGRLDAEAQVARLAPLIGRALAAFGLVERAATVASGVAGSNDPDRAVALSVRARLLTEDLAQDAVAAVERAIGLAHFATGSETGRIARDLSTYCRQAARDALDQRSGRLLLTRVGPLSGLWHG